MIYTSQRPIEHKDILTSYALHIGAKAKSIYSFGIILSATCNYFQVKEISVLGKSRLRKLVIARMCAMYLMRKKTDYTLKEVGEFFNRDHTTVIHSIRFITDQLSIPDTNDILFHIQNINIKLRHDIMAGTI